MSEDTNTPHNKNSALSFSVAVSTRPDLIPETMGADQEIKPQKESGLSTEELVAFFKTNP